MMDNITPGKCLIVANGVQSHNEFVALAKERLGELLPVPEHEYGRSTSEYIGGETRTWTETPNTSITVAFESVPWQAKETPAFFVMNTLIGSAQGFSAGGPGKGMHCRAINNVMAQYNFVDNAAGVNSHFTDSGLWGMTLEGPASHSKDLMYVLLQELHRLREPIPDEELIRAKNILKMNILQTLEKSDHRLEEVAKNYMTFGTLTHTQYLDAIESVTSD